jgi:CRISPR/Cas system endoribonuclease Cas6 (RAMP superfamily)
MDDINSLDYYSISRTIEKLKKNGKTDLVNKLFDIINHSELEKSEKHNRKDDKTTSHFVVELEDDEFDEIKDMFLDLEVSSLDENGEATASTSLYVNLLNKWLSIS